MSRRKTLLSRIGAGALGGVLAAGLLPAGAQAQEAEFHALLFTKTEGYRHASIPAGIAMFENLAAEHNFTFDHTEDSTVFNETDLAEYDVVIMFQTSGMVWENDAQREAMQSYVEDGGGIAAIHNATDMGIENDFPYWDDLVNAGAHMPSHSPGVLDGTAKVTDHRQPSTEGLPARWERAEEWYNFDKSMRGDVHVLVSADESTYDPGPDAMGADHPISWCRDVGLARVWATAMGHDTAAYSEELFIQHILGGVRTAARTVDADCSATVDSAFEKVALDTNTQAPTAMDIAPDGRVFYTEILGRVMVYDPAAESTSTAMELPVYSGGEDGLVGLVLDPDFSENGWVYLYYSPPGEEEINRVSRFTVEGNTISQGTEAKILDIPASRRAEPGHTGGYLTFGPDGNLYIGVGDDTNPFESSGFTPIDEREGRDLFDAQKTAANTNDLRGKILRITPQADGGYTVPEGNMFAPGTEKTLPEIYAMGFRNPFRFTVDIDGTIYLADYGPDSGTADPNRGPDGKVEWNIVKEPGFYGWPYCVANNIAYNDYDFATGTSGEKFDCANPVNDSPNNTGLTELPAAQEADVWYGYGASEEFPILGTGGAAPMGGPVYRYDPALDSEIKFPEYYDGKPFFYEWARNKIYTITLDEQGEVLNLDPWLTSQRTLAPMDMRFGPDGALYLLEWGGGYGRDNPDSGLYRIEYNQGNRRPVVEVSADPTSGTNPLAVSFSSEGTHDPEQTEITYSWDFGDGGTSTEANPTHTYTENGQYNVQLTVTDATGKTGVGNVTVTVGNTAPSVSVKAPADGGFFEFGDRVPFDVDVTDAEDGEIDCAEVVVQPALGHDAHAHPMDPVNACEGVIETIVDDGHAGANIFYSVDASYTDHGGDGVPALTGRDTVVLQPKHKQAEYFTSSQGIRVVNHAGAENGKRIGDISDGDWIAFTPVNFTGIDEVSLRVSAPDGRGGAVELRAGAVDGPLVAEVDVPATGGWDKYVELPPVAVTDPGGTTELFVVFRGGTSPFDLDSLTFIGDGVAQADGEAPTVTVSGVEDGASYGDSGDLTLGFEATDSGSGVASVEATLDGEIVDNGVRLPLYTLDLGAHELVVTATDKAGNTAERKVTFTVTTSVEDLRALVKRFAEDERVSRAVEKNLDGRLVAVEKLRRTDVAAAATTLEKFVAEVEKQVRDEEVKTVLVRDARALIEQWRA
ncbi:ThuA domain-containing protein [Saccharomonospora xinjiangensis]|uniref:Glucose/sorbosone dehydrogenase n=1 Tax=Saccharomonospora xinjiangensis XJ-54 TaxID=882086 RepID=I0UYP1_9PSEU|nr:ThuA domain-containing protein [Saccharomonospora xinjiangensis]EID52994.1 glucose/sorbosone dehydrogenase [Saccharomonospora xinjiangensis XJ-54]